VEQHDKFQDQLNSETYVETQFHNADDLEKSSTDLDKEQE